MSAQQLEREGLHDAGGEYDAATDKRGLEAINRSLGVVDDELEAARQMNDLGRIEGLELDRERLLAEVARSRGLGQRIRRGSAEAERARTWARKCIKRAINKLRDVHPALAEHLTEQLTTGSSCAYDGSVAWVTTPTE